MSLELRKLEAEIEFLTFVLTHGAPMDLKERRELKEKLHDLEKRYQSQTSMNAERIQNNIFFFFTIAFISLVIGWLVR